MPNDGGNLLLSDDEKTELLSTEPAAMKFIRPLLGSHEFINGIKRWCLWLKKAQPEELRQLSHVMGRVRLVREYRSKSNRMATKALADTPTLFGEIRQPTSSFVLVPRHSSEGRSYVPFGFFGPEDIVHDSCSSVPNATLYHFGVLSSAMHMAWMRTVCGRLKNDFRYSNTLVYNNFPWPQSTPAQAQAIEEATQGILDARAAFPDSTLADLYDPNTMPPELMRAHRTLDKAVDAAYRKQPFDTERSRVEYLFGLYQQLTAPLMNQALNQRRKR